MNYRIKIYRFTFCYIKDLLHFCYFGLGTRWEEKKRKRSKSDYEKNERWRKKRKTNMVESEWEWLMAASVCVDGDKSGRPRTVIKKEKGKKKTFRYRGDDSNGKDS